MIARPAALAVLALLLPGGAATGTAGAQRPPPVVVGDAIPAPLTRTPGDPAKGRAIVADRRKGLCLLCHSGPIPEERFQGTLAPGLAGAGGRWTEGQLRLRLVDPSRANPDSLMPAYLRADGFSRVGEAWRGRTILTPQEIEDVIAYLRSLAD